MNHSKLLGLASAVSLLFPSLSFAEDTLTDSTATRLEPAVVTGVRGAADLRHLPFTVDVIDSTVLSASLNSNVLPTLMEQIPSLMLTSRGMMGYGVSTNAAGGLNMRGISGGAGQMMVLIDGHPQYNGIYGHPISDSYQTILSDRVEVLRGPASVLYGSNAMGGVINIVTRKAHSDGLHGSIDLGAGSYGTIDAQAGADYRKGAFSATAAAWYGRSDNHRPNMEFDRQGGHLKLAYDLSTSWKLWADGNLTHFNASNPGPESALLYDARQWITRGVASVGLDNDFGVTSGSVSVYDNFGFHKINDGTTDPLAEPVTQLFNSRDALRGLSAWQSVSLFSGNRTTFGVDLQSIYGKAWYTDIDSGETLDRPKMSGESARYELAGYVDFRQDLLSVLSVDAGIRYDYHNIAGGEWVPQAGIVLRPIPSGTLKLMAGKGFRNPTMRELYLYRPANDELRAERLWNYELSWRHSVEVLNYGANVFYLKGSNMIQTVMVGGSPLNVNTGEIENAGVEAQLSARLSDNLLLTSNASYLHMKYPVIAAPQGKAFLGANWNCGKFSVNGGLLGVLGMYTSTGDNAQQEDFLLLNLNVSYRLNRTLTLWAKGDNLLAQEYEYIAGFPMPRATAMGGIRISL